uniref:RNA helicase n=1 Tax=Ditylenchus dipsaci TaxID=166011 RepID=A0A915D2U3_9BILA
MKYDYEIHNYGWNDVASKHQMQRTGNFPKYMPSLKRDEELFDEVHQIPKGPKFEEQFQEQPDLISISGGDGHTPVGIKSFYQCGFTPEMNKNLLLRKYTRPLPIQSYIIPLIQNKHQDIVAQAHTGSGKTAAFMCPIINEIQLHKEERKMAKNLGYPFVVLITSSKELAEQLFNDARLFSQGSGVDVALSFGDMSLNQSVRNIKEKGCDIFIGTIGRVCHFVKFRIVHLTKLRYFILDEAEKLLKDDFFDDIVQLKRYSEISPNHRTIVCSATFDDRFQDKFEEFLCPDYFFVKIKESNHAIQTVNQKIFNVSRFRKEEFLVDLLLTEAETSNAKNPTIHYDVQKTIVFVAQRRRADLIAIALACHGFKAISLHDRTLQQRCEAMDGFIRGKYDIMVATDVAARGLNVPHISHVINFDVPKLEVMSYIHRIGRTGRAGNLGRATTFFDVDDDAQHASFYVKVLKDANQEVPEFLQQIVDNRNLADEKVPQDVDQKNRESQEVKDIWS